VFSTVSRARLFSVPTPWGVCVLCALGSRLMGKLGAGVARLKPQSVGGWPHATVVRSLLWTSLLLGARRDLVSGGLTAQAAANSVSFRNIACTMVARLRARVTRAFRIVDRLSWPLWRGQHDFGGFGQQQIQGVGQLAVLAFLAAIDHRSRIRRSRDIGPVLAWFRGAISRARSTTPGVSNCEDRRARSYLRRARASVSLPRREAKVPRLARSDKPVQIFPGILWLTYHSCACNCKRGAESIK
jgi:hypothetical protein